MFLNIVCSDVEHDFVLWLGWTGDSAGWQQFAHVDFKSPQRTLWASGNWTLHSYWTSWVKYTRISPILKSYIFKRCLLLSGSTSLHLFLSAPPSVTRVTALLPHSSGELLLLGTEDGHVFIVEVPGFRELEEKHISVEQVSSRSVIETKHHYQVWWMKDGHSLDSFNLITFILFSYTRQTSQIKM